MVLSQSTDMWGGKGSGGRRCPLGGVSRQGGRIGHGHFGHGHIGHGHHCEHIGHGGLGVGELVAAEPIELFWSNQSW